jgi:protoheme IX farnesyltransferase
VLFLVVFSIVAGLGFLWAINDLTALLGLMTVIFYNLFYTLWWKPNWAFAAVPGAIPGALPVVIGYSAVTPTIFDPACVYLFLILFLWQMPHFWAIAIKCEDDYKRGGFPVLPAIVGVPVTVFHIGLYTFAYLVLAVASPWFVEASAFYLFMVLPVVSKVLWEFFKYQHHQGRDNWLSFFVWVNISIIVFLAVPIVDKWHFVIAGLRNG